MLFRSFHYIDKREIPIDQLIDKDQEEDRNEIIVSVDLKNVRGQQQLS